MNTNKIAGCFALATGLLLAVLWLTNLVTKVSVDYWWFKSLDYQQVFVTNLTAKFLTFAIVTGIVMIILLKLANMKLITSFIGSERSILEKINKLDPSERWDKNKINELKIKIFALKVFKPVVILVSILVGYIFSSHLWYKILVFLNKTTFGVLDPVYHNDISFYIFTLPLIRTVQWLLLILSVLAVIILSARALKDKEDKDKNGDEDEDNSFTIPLYWRSIWAVIAVIIASMYRTGRYSILQDPSGAVYGAGYIDIVIWKPFYPIMTILLIIVALSCLLIKKESYVKIIKTNIGLIKQPAIIAIVIILVPACFGVSAWVVDGTKLTPNEEELERPYLQRNIEFTNYGFGTDKINVTDFPVNNSLTLSSLDSETVKKARVVDYVPATKTHKQEQEIRTYYSFGNPSIDRYEINGEIRQVIVNRRDLNIDALEDKAKTWVSKHLGYTHGIGAVMSPVDEVEDNGRLKYFVKDIPPQSSVPEINTTRTRLYYGTQEEYKITNTDQSEMDYSIEAGTAYNTYEGTGGIILNSPFKKFAIAWQNDFFGIMMSDYIQSESRLHIIKGVEERAEKIAPYLKWDSDQHFFIDNKGNGYVMLTGISCSNSMPYSEPTDLEGQEVNYARESVKAILDVVNGSITFYVYEYDPMIATSSKIYPELFKDSSEMPEKFKKHVKFSEQLFITSINVFNTYHMNDTSSFYKREDVWVPAVEMYHGEQTRMEPYNVLLDIDGKVEFILMQPVTPRGRNNMIAWYAVFQDPERYGEKIVYVFPKGELISGPIQIEAKIDQDDMLSRLITLWGSEGSGSQVLRGNLLVLPIDGSLIYIEPMYLSAEQNAIPELKAVVVAYNNKLGVGRTAGEALRKAILGEGTSIEELTGDREDVPDYKDVSGAMIIGEEGKGYTIIIQDGNGNEIERIELP
ncbi:MAG: UPF0182 family protein [Candidatus Pacebacteria bacterium]|nr:UPF0182 family protein [Candidatus Paceibacterota bacterium]